MSNDTAHLELDVSRETLARLATYVDLLRKWNEKINLVAPKTIPDAWTRHIHDSAQAFLYLPPNSRTLVDLGSGAGFPGLVLAIMASEVAPDLDVTLIESDHRKSAFLRNVIRETGAPAQVLSKRIEEVAPLEADVVTARALAAMPDLLPLTDRHLKNSGVALFLKGRTWRDEIDAAQGTWRFRYTAHDSITDENAVLLEIHELSHAHRAPQD